MSNQYPPQVPPQTFQQAMGSPPPQQPQRQPHGPPAADIRERNAIQIPGPMAVLGIILLAVVGLILLGIALSEESLPYFAGAIAAGFFVLVLIVGLFVVQPNQAMVLVLFGNYVGTVRKDGFHWVNPLTRKRRISLRVHNFQTQPSKVNDAEGNPIEIAAVVVWRVVDTAKALFAVHDYDNYVAVQSETAIRSLAQQYPYDDFGGYAQSLRGNPNEVAATLTYALQERLVDAGVEVVEARLTHLAYATEIAEAMLRRQQATAVVAARQKIVEGAVGMVEEALDMLKEREIVQLDQDQKAAMVSNLLMVLTSETSTTPVVSAGPAQRPLPPRGTF